MRRFAGVLLAPLVVMAGAGTATAATIDLYDDYRANGRIDGCQNTEANLEEALETIPGDIAAYDPGFAEALNTALNDRALGCSGEDLGLGDALVAIPGASPDGSPGPPPAPVSVIGAPAAPDGPSSAPLVALALVTLALAGTAAGVQLLRRRSATS